MRDEFWKHLARLQEQCKNLGYIKRQSPDNYDDLVWLSWDMEQTLGELKSAIHQARGPGEGA